MPSGHLLCDSRSPSGLGHSQEGGVGREVPEGGGAPVPLDIWQKPRL